MEKGGKCRVTSQFRVRACRRDQYGANRMWREVRSCVCVVVDAWWRGCSGGGGGSGCRWSSAVRTFTDDLFL